MQPSHLAIECPVVETPRVLQVRGMFDLPASATSRIEWNVSLPLDDRPWNIGLIVGPSGCGKTTIARHLFGEKMGTGSGRDSQHIDNLDARPVPVPIFSPPIFSPTHSILDDFPPSMSIKDIVALLSSVGFSSPPAWLRPFHALSTGQQFRVTLARLLADSPDLAVMDEFTSVVDRTVAQIGSAALAKTVRARKQRFVAVTCHEDVESWLQPDWVYRPAEGSFLWRQLQRRPPITLTITRCTRAAWPLFHHHHYLSGHLNPSATCFLATIPTSIENRKSKIENPVAFSAWLPFVGAGPPARREHRTVTLPDYQGVGIGMALSGLVASLWKALGYRALSTTTHPAFTAARLRSAFWRMTRPPSLAAQTAPWKKKGMDTRLRHATTRLTAGFEYTGPALDYATAARLMRQGLTRSFPKQTR
jgi:energy-coupling factor transporter ATP-binding protein EcfA2